MLYTWNLFNIIVLLITLCDTDCLAVHTVRAVCWIQGGCELRMEDDIRGHRTFRHVHSLLADAAAWAVDTLYSSSRGWPNGHRHAPAFLGGAHIHAYHTQPSTKRAPRDMHVQCYKRAQLLQSLFTKDGVRARGGGERRPDHDILTNLLFPYNYKSTLPLF